MDNKEIDYLINKRQKVLDTIKPICEVFGIDNYDYIIKDKILTETLILNGQEIGCSGNSMSAIIEELIGYIFIKIYCKNRWWYHKPQTMKAIKEYWIGNNSND